MLPVSGISLSSLILRNEKKIVSSQTEIFLHQILVRIKDIASALEMFAPLPLQDGFDNAGLQIGLTDAEVTGVLLCLDVTEAVVDEAIASGCNLIVSHHPLIFSPLKRITGSNYIERCVIKALANGVAIYSAHTNIDNAPGGVNYRIAEKLGLQNVRILVPKEDALLKLAVYVPTSAADAVRDVLFAAGCGNIGNYGSCSYNIDGFGTFKAGEGCNPFCGEVGELHCEPEVRIETVLPAYLKSKAVAALIKAHPYEEPAFDIYQLKNGWGNVGSGVIGELSVECDEAEFLQCIKEEFNVACVRHTPLLGRKVKRVALCGGAGGSFAGAALAAGADVYLTGEARYHDLFNYTGKMVMAVIGHYESEQYTMDIFREIIEKACPGVKVLATAVNTNPVNYL
ncbi:MAG: Nif3-like dinuclear metal center hexameric protein [Bacteroidaceae bacterium]|nr:Nif3-like dinuclear metal center hexameric protein [Bacteroidaceae bacterium]